MPKSIPTRLLAVLGASGLLITGLLVGPTNADEVVSSTTTIKHTPDDGNPPWARDSLNRVTTITKTGEGTYEAKVTDTGTFTTARKADGAKTPGDASQTIKRRVTGDLNGVMTFEVTGTLKGERALAALQAKDDLGYNHKRFATKQDVPASRQSGKWAARYFKEGAQVTLTSYEWKYTTPCESMTQDNVNKVQGNITGKKCAEPEPEPTAPPTQKPCPTPTYPPGDTLGGPGTVSVKDATATTVRVRWSATPEGAVAFAVFANGKRFGTIYGHAFRFRGLKRNTTHTFTVRAVGKDGGLGVAGSVKGKTKK